MTLTPGELLTLTDLQRQIYCIKEDIKYLTALAVQLSNDQCELKLSFELHNKTVCDNNKATSPTQMQGLIAVLSGEPILHRPQKQCRFPIELKTDASYGLRMLQVILDEKKAIKETLQQEINKIFFKHIPSDNPIHSLHTTPL